MFKFFLRKVVLLVLEIIVSWNKFREEREFNEACTTYLVKYRLTARGIRNKLTIRKLRYLQLKLITFMYIPSFYGKNYYRIL